MRLHVTLHQPPEVTDAEIAEQVGLRDARGRLWHGGAAKFFIDGVVEPGTAWLEEPDTNGGGTQAFWPDVERFRAVVARYAGAGFSCTTHAIGDRAVRETLDAYRAAGTPPGAMHRVEHIETVADDVLARFAAEGVGASMQPIHLEGMRGDREDPWSLALGPQRAARAFRTADLARSGALLALGSDWPVARYDPRRGMAWCRLRREPGAPDDVPYGADQVLDALQTLHGYTTAPARLAGHGDRLGRLRGARSATSRCSPTTPSRRTPTTARPARDPDRRRRPGRHAGASPYGSAQPRQSSSPPGRNGSAPTPTSSRPAAAATAPALGPPSGTRATARPSRVRSTSRSPLAVEATSHAPATAGAANVKPPRSVRQRTRPLRREIAAATDTPRGSSLESP